jgi:hypothetical protein
MKKKKKKKFKQQDEFGISDYELYFYAVSRYKEATGDKSLSITGIIVYLEKEIRYYRKKIMYYDKLIARDGERRCSSMMIPYTEKDFDPKYQEEIK